MECFTHSNAKPKNELLYLPWRSTGNIWNNYMSIVVPAMSDSDVMLFTKLSGTYIR